MTNGGTVNVPAWVSEWCAAELSSLPVALLGSTEQMSAVVGVRLADGREVAVKARPDESGRAAACVTIQRRIAASGFPAPDPLTDVTIVDGTAIHAESWRGGGAMWRDDSPVHAAASGPLLADLIGAANTTPARERPVPSPVWVRWDHDDPGLWPVFPLVAERSAIVPTPAWLDDIAARVRARIAAAKSLPKVIGHADWEAQNLRWDHGRPHVVHDWDSLVWAAEAGIVGAAAGGFASQETPTLAPIGSSEAFIGAYQRRTGRSFSTEELQVAWAASLYPAAHNARGETLFDMPPVATTALRAQAEERLRRAGA